MFRYISIITACLLISGSLQAKPYTLNQLVQLAKERSLTIPGLVNQMEAIDPLFDNAGALDNSELAINLGLKQNSAATGLAYDLSYLQPLNAGKQVELIKHTLLIDKNILELTIRQTETELTYETSLSTYHYYIAQKRYAYAESRMAWVELIKTYLRGRTFASPQQKIDVLLVENRLRYMLAEKDLLLAEIGQELSRLQSLVREENFKNVEIVGLEWFSVDTNISADQSRLRQIMEDIPRLHILALEIERSTTEFALAQISTQPQWSAGGSLSQENAGETETVIKSALQISLPIHRKQEAQLANLGKKQKALEQLLKQEQSQWLIDVSEINGQWQSMKKQVVYYPVDLIEQHHELLQTATDYFKKGQIDLISLLELEGQISEAAYRALELQTDLAKYFCKFNQLTSIEKKLLRKE